MLTYDKKNFEDKDNQKCVYYSNKKSQRNKFAILNDLFDRIIVFRELKISKGTYKKRYL